MKVCLQKIKVKKKNTENGLQILQVIYFILKAEKLFAHKISRSKYDKLALKCAIYHFQIMFKQNITKKMLSMCIVSDPAICVDWTRVQYWKAVSRQCTGSTYESYWDEFSDETFD